MTNQFGSEQRKRGHGGSNVKYHAHDWDKNWKCNLCSAVLPQELRQEVIGNAHPLPIFTDVTAWEGRMKEYSLSPANYVRYLTNRDYRLGVSVMSE